MRAVVCREYGPPEQLIVEDRPSPVARAGEVVVEVKAAGVNFTDVLATQGRSQLKIKPPFTPGVEVAGIVKQVGSGVTRVHEGTRVLATCYHGGYADEIAFATWRSWKSLPPWISTRPPPSTSLRTRRCTRFRKRARPAAR